MDHPYDARPPQKLLIPQGTLRHDQFNYVGIPYGDDEIFVAGKSKGQRTPNKPGRTHSSKPGGVPAPLHTAHSVVSVGPEPAELESREQENIADDLKDFQEARRRLYYDVLTLQMTKVRKRHRNK